MARLGEMLGFGDNPFYKAFDSNRNAFTSAFANMGADPLNPWAGWGQGFQRGAMVDTLRADEAEEAAKLEEQTNATRTWLEQQGYTDLVPLVDAGQGSLAFQEALKRMQPKAAPDPFTLSPGEVRYDGAGNVIAQGPEQGVDPKTAFANESDLYRQYVGTDPVKSYQGVRNAYEHVQSAATQNTGAGDVALVYGFMKMLDPTSVVREGEYATAEQTAGLPQQVVGLYNKLLSGQRLTPQQKEQFVQAAQGVYEDAVGNLNDINQQFTTRAQGWNVNPSNFLIQPETYQPVNLGGQGAPRTTSTGVTWSP